MVGDPEVIPEKGLEEINGDLLEPDFWPASSLGDHFRFARDPLTRQFDALAFATGERAQRPTRVR